MKSLSDEIYNDAAGNVFWLKIDFNFSLSFLMKTAIPVFTNFHQIFIDSIK